VKSNRIKATTLPPKSKVCENTDVEIISTSLVEEINSSNNVMTETINS